MREEFYVGPRTDTPVTLGINAQGDEVLVSGHLHVQAFHPEGDREIYLMVYRDDLPIIQKVAHCSFEHGRLEEKIPFGTVDLPDGGYHVYTLAFRIVAPDGGPAYTGQPHFNNKLRVREIHVYPETS